MSKGEGDGSGSEEGAVVVKKTWTEEVKAEVVEAVLERMAEGKTVQDSVTAIWRGWDRDQQLRCPAKLSPGVVRRWIAEEEGWWKRYQRMRLVLGQAMAEEAIRVARESTAQTTATDRVLIETLKWAASKSNPAEYGERQTVEHQGSQQLQVRVVEEGVPVKAVRAVEGALEQAVLANGEVLTLLPGGKG